VSVIEPEAQAAHTDNWEQHWSSYAEAAALNPAQTYRRKLVFQLLGLDTAPKPVRLLELGSGQGDFARDLAAAHPDVEIAGLELSATGVEIAAGKVPKGRFFQCDMSRPVTPPPGLAGWATHAVCSEVLEHLDDPAAVLRNVRPLFAPGCRLAITVPGGPMSAFDRHIGHRRHFTPALLTEVIAASGLAPELVRGAGFPFFNIYRLFVVARGKALIADVDQADGRPLPWAARAAMRSFDWLFRWNRPGTMRGWQLVARAVEPAPGAP
jgi:2-polyprenyl-3-methyl-5-hydroxy-6-metoxy-1,4-benzoquinol methylase